MGSFTAAADGSHMQGAMIALMPTREDAERLAIEGGEAVDQLHLTLFFLGDDGTAFSEEERSALVDAVRGWAPHGPIPGRAFGANHWNPGSDSPSWVWAVGDERDDDRPFDSPRLESAYTAAKYGIYDTLDPKKVPNQYTPWQPHICAAYSEELDLVIALEERLGPVTFDRIRVAFAGDHTEIPLGGDMTASARILPSRWDEDVVHVELETNHGGGMLLEAMRPAIEGLAELGAELGVPIRVSGRTRTTARTAAAGPLRRQPTDLEVASCCDFSDMNDAWHKAVDDTVEAWAAVQEAQRAQIVAQVQAAVDAEDLDRLDTASVDTGAAANLLFGRMQAMARRAGEAQQREAEEQGVDIPEWSLDDEALVAAPIRDRIRQVAATTARLLGVGLVQSAVRQAVRLFGSGSGAQVADAVDEHLAGLSGAVVEEAVGAAMSAAQNEGRMAVLAVAPPATYTASEILDRSSCAPCRAIDGTRYTTLTAARAAYPTGGYTGCLGGSRCRGTLVTVWPQTEEEAAAAGTITLAAGATLPQTDEGGGAVPYRIMQDHPDCAADTPWAVVKEATDELMGCHPSEAAAMEQQAALYAAENDKPDEEHMDYAGQTAPWRGPLAVEGKVTGDGREFAPDALTWAELPAPLRWNKEDSHGGEPKTVAVNVGRIDKVWRDGDLIMGEGVLDLSDDDGRRVHAKIKGKFLRGVSIDADSIADADVEFVWPDDANQGIDGDGEDDLFEMLFAQPEKVIFHGGRIRAATLVDIPAFAEAYIALLDEAGAVVAGGQPIGVEALQALTVQEPDRPLPALAASAADGPWRAPAAWFSDPKLSLPTGITITDEGRIYGHAAQWGSCHIGNDGACIQPPREAEHPYYRTGEVKCEDGSRVAVGQITVGTGHAPLHLGASPAAEHYDNTGTAVADVTVGNDAHGIWVAGAVRPGADPLKVYELQAAGQVSGDWRRIGGQLRLVGLLAVNVPGFPVPRMRARVASGEPQALVAAGRPQVAFGLSEGEVQRQALRVVMGMLRDRVHGGR